MAFGCFDLVGDHFLQVFDLPQGGQGEWAHKQKRDQRFTIGLPFLGIAMIGV
jgi:hypothetical protein